MMRMKKRGWREVIVLLAALACAGSWAASQVRSMRDRSEVANMTEKMKPICVGRFLVDVPAQAEVTLSREMIDGFAIATAEESEAQFRARVAAREADIVARGANPQGNGEGGMVEARDIRVSGMAGRSLVYGYSRGYLMQGERRVDMESVSVEVHAHTAGLSFSLSAKSTKEGSIREAEALLTRLRVRAEGEIPSVPGFCIGRAVFVDPLPAHKTEHVVMHIGLPDHPDLAMAFASLPGGRSTRSLLTRVADMDADASPDEMLRVTKLRTGERHIKDMAGEEVLERVREFNFATTFGFMWETDGVKDDPLKPFLSLELHAGISPEPGGKPADASLHEDAVLALWDAISSSIRLRPNGPPPTRATFAHNLAGGNAARVVPASTCTAARCSSSARASACPRRCCCPGRHCGKRSGASSRAWKARA